MCESASVWGWKRESVREKKKTSSKKQEVKKQKTSPNLAAEFKENINCKSMCANQKEALEEEREESRHISRLSGVCLRVRVL